MCDLCMKARQRIGQFVDMPVLQPTFALHIAQQVLLAELAGFYQVLDDRAIALKSRGLQIAAYGNNIEIHAGRQAAI